MTQAGAPPKQRSRRQRTLTRDFVEVVLIALALYVAISVGFQTVRVDGFSMMPTLQTQDFLLATKIAYHLHDPERGDIIVLQPPDAADQGKDFIKRIIGLPGDTIEIDGGYVDPTTQGSATTAILIQPGGRGPWQRLAEEYLPEPWTTSNYCCASTDSTDLLTTDSKPRPLKIPQGMYFVLGDNRNASRDSRFIGLIPRANILAKAWFRMYPFGQIGGLGAGPTLVPANGVTSTTSTSQAPPAQAAAATVAGESPPIR